MGTFLTLLTRKNETLLMIALGDVDSRHEFTHRISLVTAYIYIYRYYANENHQSLFALHVWRVGTTESMNQRPIEKTRGRLWYARAGHG